MYLMVIHFQAAYDAKTNPSKYALLFRYVFIFIVILVILH